MRKSHLLSVFLLFLLVPASITRAQTAYLTGTVSIEQDYRNVNFSSPQGNVKIILPGVLSYPGQGTVMLSGTVVAEPAGKTEKEKTSNLKALQKMLLTIDGISISILPGQNHFDFSVPANLATPVPIDMVDPGGNRATVNLKNPVVSLPPTTGTLPAGRPTLMTDQKIFLNNGNIPVYAANNGSTLFQPTDEFFVKDASGNMMKATKMAQSPTQTVLGLPSGFQGGATTITRQAANRTDQTKVRVVDLSLTSPNTNLRKGQTSSLTVTIDPKITERDTAEAMQIPIMSLDMKNITPGVVEMSGGNMQVMNFPTSPGSTSPSAWQATRTITGIKPGNFNISATLYPSYTLSNDMAHSQKYSLRTCDQFNRWIVAVKRFVRDIDYKSNGGRYTERILEILKRLPWCETNDDLGTCMTAADELLRDLEIDLHMEIPAVQITSASLPSFATYLAASENLMDTTATNPGFVHTDVIQGGLSYVQQEAIAVKNPELTQAITAAENANSMLEKNYNDQNISILRDALQKLNNSPFVTGQAQVFATTTPHMLEADGPIGATKDGKEIMTGGSIGQSVEVYDDNTVVINTSNKTKERFDFTGITPSGTTLKRLVMEFYNRRYPIPTGLGCDSLTKLCRETQALTIFWGDIYSVTNGKMERSVAKGVTRETNTQSSLLISRGWEMDCCTGLFKCKLFFQAMQGGQTVSLTEVLNSGSPRPCPILDCPECKKKCDDMKKMMGQK